MSSTRIVRENLNEQVGRVEMETRMVLPGIQALFGFQLVAVFNERFVSLTETQQTLHWLALAFTAIATMLTMAPAAFHRQAEPSLVSERFVHHSNCWLSISLAPLMLGICIDFFIIGVVITKNSTLSLVASGTLLAGYIFFWYVFPWLSRRHEPIVTDNDDDD